MDPAITGQLGNQIVVAVVMTWFLKKLKDSNSFPWLTEYTARANRIAAGFLALIGTLGITIVCAATAHTCTMHYPDGPTFAKGVMHWAQQFAVMHGWYKITTNNTPA